MSLPGGVPEALARALLVALVLAGAAPVVESALRRWRLLWVVLLLPLLTPSIAMAY